MALADVRGLRPSDIRSIEVSLRALIGDLAPDDVPIAYATQVWESFDAIERLAASAKTLLARRVEQTGSWERKGFRSAAEQLASISGTSEAAAQRQLQTSKQLEALPATADAARAGRLSAQKVEAIASAAMVAPDAEGDLLREAAAPLAHVREECLRAKGRGDRELSYARIQRERFSREWTDAEGAWNFMARGTIDAGARFRAVFEPIVEEIFTTARSEGRKEPRGAYAFDALIGLAERADTPTHTRTRKRSPRFLGLVRVDHEALRRGAVDGDEVCEIAGLGPVPVGTARELLGESILQLVVTKGVDVVNTTNLRRSPTMAQRVALWWQSPTCRILGCTRTRRLEIDHHEGWANTHRTELRDLGNLCNHHHLKTYDGWDFADADRRILVAPGDPRHPRNKAPPEP